MQTSKISWTDYTYNPPSKAGLSFLPTPLVPATELNEIFSGGGLGVVTNQELEDVAKKTGLEVEEVLSKYREALMRNASYVKIVGPKNKVRLELLSIKASPDEGALARKWLSDHAAQIPPMSDYIAGAVDIRSLDSIDTPKRLAEIAKIAKISFHDKHLRTAYAEEVRGQRYASPNSQSSPNWYKTAIREHEAWEHRPRICDNKIKHRLENMRKSSKIRRNCSSWFHDDMAVFVVLLLKHRWETRPDKIVAEETRREFDAVKYWTDTVVSDDSPLLGLTGDHVRVTVDRLRKFGNANLPPKLPGQSFEEIALFIWALLLKTSNPKMTRPFASLRAAMRLAQELLNTPIPLDPRYLKTHPPESSEKVS